MCENFQNFCKFILAAVLISSFFFIFESLELSFQDRIERTILIRSEDISLFAITQPTFISAIGPFSISTTAVKRPKVPW